MKDKMQTLKMLLVAMLICLVTSGNIIPDSQNPLQMKFPTNSKAEQSLVFRFSLPSDTVGLHYNQYIGVQFATSANQDLKLAENTTPKWSCTLTDSTNKPIAVAAKTSEASPIKTDFTEANIAYCKIDELLNVPLVAGTNYVLTIKFVDTNNLKPFSGIDFIRNVGLFTSTANHGDKIIIDSLPVFGNLGMYADLESSTISRPLEISSVSSSAIIYPYTSFDLSLTFTANTFIPINDVFILIKYPSENFQHAQSITTSQFSEGDLTSALKGNLSIFPFDKNHLIISGITEDLVPGRKFKIDLKQWKANDITGNDYVDRDLILYVYYKNTFSVFSYYKSSSTFTITKATFNSNNTIVKHTENWDIYRNAAWPLQINFKLNSDLTNGGFVLIQQVKAKENNNRLSFVPASCDFSEFDTEQSFGKRANCYPIRHDNTLVKSTSVSTDFNGSGFFFNFKNLYTTKEYKLKVWAFADSCGGDNYNVLSADEPSVKPKFKITIYRRIQRDRVFEERFKDQIVLAESDEVTFSSKCWNTKISKNVSGDTNHPQLFADSFTADNGNDAINLPVGSSPNSASKRDFFLFKELTDWSLFPITDAYTSSANTKINNLPTESFIYSNTNNLSQGPFTIIRARIFIPGDGNVISKFRNLLAWPITSAKNTATPPVYDFVQSKTFVQYSTAWFTPTPGINLDDNTNVNNKGCYVSWGLNYQASSGAAKTGTSNFNEMIFSPFNAYLYVKTDSSATAIATGDKINLNYSNFFSSFLGNLSYNSPSTVKSTMDKKLTILKDDTLKIVSELYQPLALQDSAENYKTTEPYATNNAVNAGATLLPKYTWSPFNVLELDNDLKSSDDPIYFGLFSSCVKFRPPSSNFVKSLYTSIDVLYGFMFSNTEKVNRLNRFVKLYPEGGVFQDTSKVIHLTANPINIHFTHVAPSERAVCILEVIAQGITGSGIADSGNTLLIWIYYGTLLETDYEDPSSTYPVAPLLPNVNAYSFQNGIPQSSDNLQNSEIFNKDHGTLDVLTKNTLLGSSGSGNDRSRIIYHNYNLFMGSWIAIIGDSSGSVSPNETGTSNSLPFMIPFYCPNKSDTAAAISSSTKLPAVMMTWMSMTSHISPSVTKLLGYNKKSTNGFNSRKVVVFNRLPALDSISEVDEVKTFTSANTNSNIVVTLRFSQYTSNLTNSDNTLYMFNYAKSTPNGNSANHCTGHVLFVNKEIVVDTNVTANFPNPLKSGTFGPTNTTKSFYVYGKEFHKAILTGIGKAYTFSSSATADNINSTDDKTSTSVSDYSWTKIKRPTIETFTNFDTWNYLGFYCASVARDKTNILTNFSKDNKNSFLLDYNRDLTKSWTVSLGFDKTEAIKNDTVGGIRLSVTTPDSVPAKTLITINSGGTAGINPNSFCGIYTTLGAIVNDCNAVSGTKIQCPTPSAGKTFNVCCYNVNLSGDSFIINALTADINIDPSLNVSNVITNGPLYSAENQIGTSTFNISSTTSSNNDISNPSFKAFINSVKYSNVKQEGGYGKAQFEITLPRQLLRNMRITVNGDLQNMLIPNNIPRCVATFSTTFGRWDSGDILIDSCSTAGFTAANNPIVITTKKIVYKCGLSFGKTLNIFVWPVVEANWSSTATTNAYKVLMNGINGTDTLAYNTEGFNMPNVVGLDAKPSASQLETLCPVNTIMPKIPGERAEYQFEFDLDLNKAALATNAPNEVTIFFPYNHFGSIIDNVLCLYNSALTNCSFTDEGILNIRFNQSLPVGSGKKVIVTVSGIPNPAANSDFYIPCTVNFTNFSTQKRINLIVGTGKVGAITILENAVVRNIRFLSVPAAVRPLSDSNPRNTSTHIFRVQIDKANNFNSDYSITNNPFIVVSFPPEYKLSWFSNIKPTATIDPYTNDAVTNAIVKGNSIVPTTVTLNGNNIIMNLPDPTYTFNATFRYWDIKISNIVGPMDNTGDKTNLATSSYKVILTNNNYSTIFRTYSNLNSHAYNLLPANSFTPAEPYLSHYRGNTFLFDNKSWVVDIKDKEINSLSLSPGRYITSYFVIKTNTASNILPSISEIRLTDAVFKTLDSSYTLYSSLNEPLPFLIGCACGTAPGKYLLNFSLTVPSRTPAYPTNWAPMWPVQINVDNNSVGTIQYSTPPNIPAGGSVWITLSLNAPTFDELNVTWTDGDNAKNDKSASFTGVKIPAGTITSVTAGTNVGVSNIRCQFAIADDKIFDTQSYKTDNPNSCWQWTSKTITFTIQGQTAIIPQDYNFTNSIIFYNADSDNTLSKNSVRFNIKLNYAPVYLYCALVCLNSDYPSNDIIKKPTTVNTQLLQFYSGVYTSATGSDVIFNGLIRGQKYKLRCIIESVQGDVTKRTSTAGNFEKYTAPNGTTWDIMPSQPQPTYCAQYLFDNEPGQETKIAMINYCQRLFSAPGWSTNGCVICTDSELTYTVPGVNLPTIQCVAAATAKLRFLQTTPTTTPTTTTTTATNPNPTTTNTTVIPTTVTENKTILFSVCAISSPSCARDVSGSKGYLDYFNQLRDDLSTPDKFKKTLDIINAQVRSVNTYSDTTAPVITTDTLKITGLTSALNGVVKFKVNFPNPLKCYYQISTAASTAAPSFDTLMNCKDAMCGLFKPSSLGVDVTTGSSGLKPLTPNTQYNLFVGCTNDIPFSQKRSAVISAFTFTSPQDTTVTPTNNTCTNGTVWNVTTQKCDISAGFIQYSFALLMLLALLFN